MRQCNKFDSRYPLTIESGDGCWLTTTDGQKYLDCVSGIATCALGHSNEALNKAVTKQMESVHHVSNLYFIPTQAGLANWLCENSNADKAFFCNSGAEANEAAIKCARRHASNRGIEVRSVFLSPSLMPARPGKNSCSLRNLCLPIETCHHYCGTIFSWPNFGGTIRNGTTEVSQGVWI